MKINNPDIRERFLSKIYEDTLTLFKVTAIKLQPNKTNTWKAAKVFIIIATDAGYVLSELANFLNVEPEKIKKLRITARQSMTKGELDDELNSLREKYPPNAFQRTLDYRTKANLKEKQEQSIKDAIREGKINGRKRLQNGDIPVVLRGLIPNKGKNHLMYNQLLRQEC